MRAAHGAGRASFTLLRPAALQTCPTGLGYLGIRPSARPGQGWRPGLGVGWGWGQGLLPPRPAAASGGGLAALCPRQTLLGGLSLRAEWGRARQCLRIMEDCPISVPGLRSQIWSLGRQPPGEGLQGWQDQPPPGPGTRFLSQLPRGPVLLALAMPAPRPGQAGAERPPGFVQGGSLMSHSDGSNPLGG